MQLHHPILPNKLTAGCAVLVFILFFQTDAQHADPVRQRISFNDQWKFHLGDLSGAELPGFDDSAWRILDLPHDWSIEGDFDRNAPTTGRGGYLPTGIGWYRKEFTIDISEGDQLWIEFDGIYQNSDVWVNGYHLGRYPNGYLSFYYHIQDHMREGQNVIAVRVDNSLQPNSRWYSGSGIYRNVWLNVSGPLHVAPRGVYITTPDINEEHAIIQVETRIANASNSSRHAVLSSAILDQECQQITGYENGFIIGERDTVLLYYTLIVEEPKLWSVDSPELYRLVSQIRLGDDTVDADTTTFGIRSIEYTADRGFILNGKLVKMNGVNLHHDGGSVGAAVPVDVWKRRLAILKEMGCNAIRTAHNPVAPEFLDLCDEMGFLVMNEIFDEWERGKIEYGYHRYFGEWSQRDLVNFIRRDRNHPSVVMWSAGNEIGEQSVERGEDVLRALLETFKREDPTRPVTTGNDHIAADGRRASEEFLEMLDIVGYNYVDRWHERRELYFTPDKIVYPDWKVVGTESVSARGIRGHYYDFRDSQKVRPAILPSLVRAQELWKYVSTHDFVIGDFMWTGIDYLGEARWPGKNASSGVMDLCGFPKDSYYFYQSQWIDEPVLHLFPHWNWTGREGQVIPVMVYTNCDTVELFLNGRSFGQKSIQYPRPGNSGAWNRYDEPPAGITTGDLYLSWDVPYTPGILKAVGHCGYGERLEKELRTTGNPAAVRISANKNVLRANNRDVAHFTVKVLDENGVWVPDATNPITLELEGPGKLIGFDNGNPFDHTNMKSPDRKLFNGLALALIQSSYETGELWIGASSPGLQSSLIRIKME